ncbi:hypothetical protein E7Y35_04755 [Spiroplasma sp. SV19]|nr:hypothetical protein E7Y35_02565 [Spiroplasma sp. SV19]WHQ37595.1 hypothetical protein E7Y35_04755 [Spiroplasma sp. SV19]
MWQINLWYYNKKYSIEFVTCSCGYWKINSWV